MLNKIRQFFNSYEIIIRKKNVKVGDVIWFGHSYGYSKFTVESIQNGYALGKNHHINVSCKL